MRRIDFLNAIIIEKESCAEDEHMRSVCDLISKVDMRRCKSIADDLRKVFVKRSTEKENISALEGIVAIEILTFLYLNSIHENVSDVNVNVLAKYFIKRLKEWTDNDSR